MRTVQGTGSQDAAFLLKDPVVMTVRETLSSPFEWLESFPKSMQGAGRAQSLSASLAPPFHSGPLEWWAGLR